MRGGEARFRPRAGRLQGSDGATGGGHVAKGVAGRPGMAARVVMIASRAPRPWGGNGALRSGAARVRMVAVVR